MYFVNKFEGKTSRYFLESVSSFGEICSLESSSSCLGSRFSCSCLQKSITKKKIPAQSAVGIKAESPKKVPIGNNATRQSAESTVKSIRNL